MDLCRDAYRYSLGLPAAFACAGVEQAEGDFPGWWDFASWVGQRGRGCVARKSGTRWDKQDMLASSSVFQVYLLTAPRDCVLIQTCELTDVPRPQQQQMWLSCVMCFLQD